MPEENDESRFLLPGLLLGLGLLSMLLLVLNDALREHVLVRDAKAARLVAEVETRIATLHLWVEEYVSGDVVDLDEIREHQYRSRAILLQLAGESTEVAATSIADDPIAAEILARLRPRVDRFVELSTQRLEGFDAGEEVGVGSSVDVAYDRSFYDLLSDLRALDEHALGRLDDAHSRSRILFRLMLLAWTAIIAFAIVAVWTHERHQRKAEKALRKSETALLQAQKMEAIGSLAGGLAHDINNYLAAISAQCEVVRMQTATDGRVAAKMDTVIGTCSRASALLERLLAFSRGRTVQPEIVNLNSVVIGLEEMAGRLIGEDLRLELHLAPDLAHTEVEVSQVEQAVVNLLVNARDAMPEGGTVRISSRNIEFKECILRLPDGGGAVCKCQLGGIALRVSDSGPGISPELSDRVFEPFFSTKDQSRHSGLGLATVYGIAEQNGGTVRLMDTDLPGTHIELCFPRTAKPLPAVGDSPRTDGAIGSGQRVLLVEDNEELRESTEELLGAMGFEVRSAEDGETALELFDAAPSGFALLLTDVIMPGITGRELADRIEARDPEIRVLFASGHTDSAVLRTGVDEEAINFLPKPYTARQLARAIDRVLSPAAHA